MTTTTTATLPAVEDGLSSVDEPRVLCDDPYGVGCTETAEWFLRQVPCLCRIPRPMHCTPCRVAVDTDRKASRLAGGIVICTVCTKVVTFEEWQPVR